MTRDLTNASAEATERQNQAGLMTPILELSPEEGLGLLIKGMVNSGEETGLPIFGRFYNQNGNLMARQTSLALQFEAPGADDRDTISFPMSNIRAYRKLSINEQQHPDHIDRVKHVLKGTDAALAEDNTPAVRFDHTESVYLAAESPDVIDWSHPDTAVFFDRNAVEDV